MITRHADAGWEESLASDHERTLTAGGRQQARELAALLLKRDLRPHALICSTALRATHTGQLVAHEMGIDGALSRHQALYQGGLQALRDALNDLADEVTGVMMVGHNPAVSSIASTLAGRTVSMQTASCAVLSCEADSWEEALEEDWVLDELVRPSERPLG